MRFGYYSPDMTSQNSGNVNGLKMLQYCKRTAGSAVTVISWKVFGEFSRVKAVIGQRIIRGKLCYTI